MVEELSFETKNPNTNIQQSEYVGSSIAAFVTQHMYSCQGRCLSEFHPHQHSIPHNPQPQPRTKHCKATMASIVSSKQRQANTCAAAASQYAASGQHQKAVDMYVAAIDALMAVRSKVDARARPAVDRQMEEYLGQAEVIKRRIKVAQPQPPARSSQLPPPVSAPTAAAAAAGATASAAAAAAGTGGAYYAARHVPTPPERCKHTHSFVHSSACVLVWSDCLYLLCLWLVFSLHGVSQQRLGCHCSCHCAS